MKTIFAKRTLLVLALQGAAMLTIAGSQLHAQDDLPANPVFQAIRKNDLAALQALVKAKPTLVKVNASGDSPLSIASSMGNLEIMRYLLEQGADPNQRNRRNSALYSAVGAYNSKNWRAAVDLLLKSGANVEQRDSEGNTTLLRLVSDGSGNKDKVQYLVEKGASLQAANWQGSTALDLALERQDAELLRVLLPAVSVKQTDGQGNTLLHRAVRGGGVEVLRLLLPRGFDVNAANLHGDTPLHVAALHPGPALKLLIAGGANANLANKSGDLPLHIGLRGGNELVPTVNEYEDEEYYGDEEDTTADDAPATPPGLILAPLTEKTDVNLRDRYGMSVTLLAVLARDSESLDMILEKAPKMDATTLFFLSVARGNVAQMNLLLAQKPYMVHLRLPDGTAPLHVAAQWGTLSAAQVLVQKGADVKVRDARGRTPLHRALLNPVGIYLRRAKAMLPFLLTSGAEVNALDAEEASPLFRAMELGDAELINPLLTAKADPNLAKRAGNTPLMELVSKGADSKLVAALLDRGAAVNQAGPEKNTALSVAIAQRKVELVKLLVAKGANMEARDGQGNTPLLAVMQSSGGASEATTRELVQLFLAKGADINAENREGNILNALINRGSEGNVELLKLLLENKKLDLKKAGRGPSPLALAISNGRKEYIPLLLEAGADPNETMDDGRTLLKAARDNKDADTVAKLTAAGAIE